MLIPYITAGFFLVYSIFITVKYQQGQKKACLREKESSRERQKEDLIFRNVNAYLLLIGKDFVVQKTNSSTLRPYSSGWNMPIFPGPPAGSSSVCTKSTPIPANNRILRYEKGLSVTENGGPRCFSRQTAVHFVCVSPQR